MTRRKCPHDGGTCYHGCEPPYCFREDRGLMLSKPDRFYREHPEQLVFRNAMVIAAAESARELEKQGLFRLSGDDSQWSIERAGGVVQRHETGTMFDWGEQETVFVEERWAEKEAVLAARTLDRVIEELT
jgi:hypothetical protein